LTGVAYIKVIQVIMAGDPTAITEIRPELEAISAPGRLFCTGPLGSASVMKMYVPGK